MDISWTTSMTVEQAFYLRKLLIDQLGLGYSQQLEAVIRIAIEAMPKNIPVPMSAVRVK